MASDSQAYDEKSIRSLDQKFQIKEEGKERKKVAPVASKTMAARSELTKRLTWMRLNQIT